MSWLSRAAIGQGMRFEPIPTGLLELKAGLVPGPVHRPFITDANELVDMVFIRSADGKRRQKKTSERQLGP